MSCRSVREVTLAEVARHNTKEDAWIVVEGDVLDVTQFMKRHPGGAMALRAVMGLDATDPFLGFHPECVRKSALWKGLLVGKCVDWTENELTKDVRAIREQFQAEGRYSTDKSIYVRKVAVYAAMLLSVLLLLSRGHWVIAAVVLGVFWQQLAFFGHDFGHNQLTHCRIQDSYYGCLVTAFFGVCGQWWRHNHNAHHVVTNSVDFDPDIQHLPFFAVNPRLFGHLFSQYYERQMPFDAIARFFVSRQHVLYVPIMLLAR
ncbi:MAG: hypothetical protein MHM6MM_008894, partial [Cercozoa sp. M6MM]